MLGGWGGLRCTYPGPEAAQGLLHQFLHPIRHNPGGMDGGSHASGTCAFQGHSEKQYQGGPEVVSRYLTGGLAHL